MDTNIHIKLGLKLDNVFFGWHNGVLYQLPYENGGRYIGLRKLRKKKLKESGWEYYHIRRRKYGIAKLRAMLQEVDWEVRNPSELT